LKQLYYKLSSRSAAILAEYKKRANNDRAILDLSIKMNFPPMGICRLILNEKYPKSDVKEMLRDPELIPDPILSANVFTCIFNDIQDGVIIDMVRYTIGEEYEVKLKQMARERGLTFYDEGDLRRDGFDKTPDLLLAVQCIYKNRIINWIESKALFGDTETHAKYVRDQLTCYENRFGAGIVIYWFGFQEQILDYNNYNLIVLDHFPLSHQLTTVKDLVKNQV